MAGSNASERAASLSLNRDDGQISTLPPLRNQTPTWDKAATLARQWELNRLSERLDAFAKQAKEERRAPRAAPDRS
jgi:hypothetical protein